jgi:nicotinamidase-related amidase
VFLIVVVSPNTSPRDHDNRVESLRRAKRVLSPDEWHSRVAARADTATTQRRAAAKARRHGFSPVEVKKRYSAFFGTPLDDVIRTHGIDTLVIAGVNTPCVRAHHRDHAYQRDLDVIIAREAVRYALSEPFRV